MSQKKCCAKTEAVGSQRVIIPEGLVDPSATTIIEIPPALNDAQAVVATPRANNNSYRDGYPAPSANETYSVPFEGPPKNSSSTSSRGQMKTRTVIETTKYTEEVPVDEDDEPLASKIENKARSFPRTALPNMSALYDEGVSYGGVPQDFTPNRSGTFYQQYIQNRGSGSGQSCSPSNRNQSCTYQNFAPLANSSMKGNQSSTYENFVPQANSTMHQYRRPKPRQGRPMSPYQSFEPRANSTMRSSSNDLDYSVPSQALIPYKDQPAKVCGHCSSKKAGNTSNSSKSGIKEVLDQLDSVELGRIQKDLKDFQLARRKLIFDASSMKH